MKRRLRRAWRHAGLCLVALAVRIVGAGEPAPANATASGCSLYSLRSAPLWEGSLPDCTADGSGCYQCTYANDGQDGFTICSENPDGTGPAGGKPLCDTVAQIPDGFPAPDPDAPPDPDPGTLPPDAPPPDSPPDEGGSPGGGSGCQSPDCHEADRAPAHSPPTMVQQEQLPIGLWLLELPPANH